MKTKNKEVILNAESMHPEHVKRWFFGLMGRTFQVVPDHRGFKVDTGKYTGLSLPRGVFDFKTPRTGYLRAGSRNRPTEGIS